LEIEPVVIAGDENAALQQQDAEGREKNGADPSSAATAAQSDTKSTRAPDMPE